MTAEPRIVTPQEAQEWIDSDFWDEAPAYEGLAHTVATEPERIAEAERRGAVKALRDAATAAAHRSFFECVWLNDRADAIENGADW